MSDVALRFIKYSFIGTGNALILCETFIKVSLEKH